MKKPSGYISIYRTTGQRVQARVLESDDSGGWVRAITAEDAVLLADHRYVYPDLNNPRSRQDTWHEMAFEVGDDVIDTTDRHERRGTVIEVYPTRDFGLCVVLMNGQRLCYAFGHLRKASPDNREEERTFA